MTEPLAAGEQPDLLSGVPGLIAQAEQAQERANQPQPQPPLCALGSYKTHSMQDVATAVGALMLAHDVWRRVQKGLL